MERSLLFLIFFLCLGSRAFSVPIIEHIYNGTEFVYDVIDHSTDSPCGLFKQEIQLYRVHPGETFRDAMILHKGDSVTLRPVAYFDNRLNDYIWFVDRNGELVEDGVEEAYNAWAFGSRSRKKMSKDRWINQWVGGHLFITIKKELYGYMLHIMHAAIANHSHIDHAWPMYSQGVYTALSLEVDLKQDRNGVKPEINATNSRGAICENGEIDYVGNEEARSRSVKRGQVDLE